MRYVSNPVVAGAVGAATTGVLAVVLGGLLVPTGTVFVGSLVAALLHWRHDDRRDFRVAGTTYALGAAGVLVTLAGVLQPVYVWTVVPSLAVFGMASALIVAVFVGIRAGGRVAARQFVPDDYAAELADFASTLASAALIVWTVIQVQERIARSAGAGLLGTGTMIANFYGHNLSVDVGMFSEELQLVVVLFVGTVLVGFHTLASWDSAWRVAERTAERSASAVEDASSTTVEGERGT